MTMSGTAFSDSMRAHLAPGHDDTGKAAKNWDFDALAGAGAMRSTANDMLRYLKANMGIDQSPLAAAMKLAQQPRSDFTKTIRIGLAWMTTAKGIIWHNGGTGGYRSFIGFTADGRAALSSSATLPWTSTISVSPRSMPARGCRRHTRRSCCRMRRSTNMWEPSRLPTNSAEDISHERRAVRPGNRTRSDPHFPVGAQ